MADINYTRGNIAKAVLELVTSVETHPRRAWEAYQIATRGAVRDGLGKQFDELDSIFRGVRHDEIETRVSVDQAKRGAMILLEMYDASSSRD